LDYDPSLYTSVDVDAEALQAGKEKYPQANWIHHDAYNPVYNTCGLSKSKLPLDDNSFDIATAYSVHSHAILDDVLWDIQELLRVSKHCVTTSFVDKTILNYFINKRQQQSGVSASFQDFDDNKLVSYYINNDIVVDHFDAGAHKQIDHFVTVFNPQLLVKFLSMQNLTVKMHPQLNCYFQPTLTIYKH